MTQALFSIVIPNWNGLTHLPICLEALSRQTHSPLEVIVVDNASSDGSQKFIRERFPDVNLIELSENRGFTGACNAGMEVATGEFVALLNNDTEVSPHWVEEVIAAFERHPDAGAVASKMLLFDRRDTLHTAGDYYRIDGIPGNRGVWQKDDVRFNREEYVFSACGGSSVYRRAMLEQVGLLDDDFFFSCEDVDLGWRGQLAGWKTVYAPQAVVYHHLAATGGDVTASFYNGRNYLWLIAKNYPTSLLKKHFFKIVTAQLKLAWEALKAWRGEAARARLRGMAVGLLTIPRMLKKRRHIQQNRTVSDAYLESTLITIDEVVQ